jgi:hypothetical protein
VALTKNSPEPTHPGAWLNVQSTATEIESAAKTLWFWIHGERSTDDDPEFADLVTVLGVIVRQKTRGY